MGHIPRVLTTAGDLLEGGTSGVWQRLPAGASNTLLGGGTSPAFTASPTVSGELTAADFKPTGLSGATAASRYVGATASGAPTSGTFAVGDFVIDQTAKIWVCTVAGTPGTWVQLSGGGSSTLAGDTDVSVSSPVGGQVLGYSSALSKWVNQNQAGVAATQTSAKLSADVTMTSANTYYDGPSIVLSPGTWLITGNLSIQAISSGGNQDLTARLWDGTTSYDSGDVTTQAGWTVAIPLTAVVTPISTTTYKLSGASSSAGSLLKAATANSSGNNASSIIAIQLSGNPVGQQAPAVRCYNSANISVPSSTDTALTFDTNRYDQGTSTPQHSTSSNTSRIICQQAGIYNIVGNIEWDNTTSSGQRLLAIKLNGSTIIGRSWFAVSSSSYFKPHVVSTEWYLSVGDYVELVATQDSGSTATVRNTSGDRYSPEFMMARIDSGPGATQPNTRVQLDYALASDTTVTLTNSTWTDFVGNQTFTVDDANSVIEIAVSGYIGVGASAGNVGTRLVVDSAGTAINKMIAGNYVGGGTDYINALAGSAPATITGLSAGSHTVKLQIYQSASNTATCRPITAQPNIESLSIRVLERKQSTSPPSSTPAPAVRCHNSTGYSISSGSATVLSFDTTDFDQGTSMPQHSTSANTSRLTCQQTGIYQITGTIRIDEGTNHELSIRLNGANNIAMQSQYDGNGAAMRMSVTTLYRLSVGDYVELTLYQNSGGTSTQSYQADFSPSFMMARVDTGGTGAVYVPVVKTANYTILPTDSMVVAGANGLTLTLPAASAYTGKPPLVIKNDGFTSTTIARAGSDVIDGATSYALVAAYSSVSLVSDSNATWRVI